MGAINGCKCLFIFTLTVGFFVDTKAKGGCIVADEAMMVKSLLRKCSSALKLSSNMSPEPALESDALWLVDSHSFTKDGACCLDLVCPLEVTRNWNSRLKELRWVDGLLIRSREGVKLEVRRKQNWVNIEIEQHAINLWSGWLLMLRNRNLLRLQQES